MGGGYLGFGLLGEAGLGFDMVVLRGVVVDRADCCGVVSSKRFF